MKEMLGTLTDLNVHILGQSIWNNYASFTVQDEGPFNMIPLQLYATKLIC